MLPSKDGGVGKLHCMSLDKAAGMRGKEKKKRGRGLGQLINGVEKEE